MGNSRDSSKSRSRSRDRDKKKKKNKKQKHKKKSSPSTGTKEINESPQIFQQIQQIQQQNPYNQTKTQSDFAQYLTQKTQQTNLLNQIQSATISDTLKIPTHLHKHYKHALRVYVGNLPDVCDENDICNFIYKSLQLAGGVIENGNPIFSHIYQPSKKYIFLQMRSIEECTLVLELDGIIYNGKSLRMRRPKDYDSLQKVEGTHVLPKLDLISTIVENSPYKLYIGNIPEQMSEEEIIEHLQQCGNLQSFHLVVDTVTNQSKGYAFCEFVKSEDSMKCIKMLHGYMMQGQNKVLMVKLANTLPQFQNLQPQQTTYNPNYTVISAPQIDPFIPSAQEMARQFIEENMISSMIQINIQNQNSVKYNYDELQLEFNSSKKSSILKIKGIVDRQKIENDTEKEEVYNDLKRQLEKVGPICQILIPRVKDGFDPLSVGCVFVEFENEKYAVIAKFAIKNLSYDRSSLQNVEFFDPLKFADQIYN